jgi:hypothetical protein
MPSATFHCEAGTILCNSAGNRNVSKRGGTLRSILTLLLIFPAALLIADTHRVIVDQTIDFSAFKTFVVRQGYPAAMQPSLGNQGTKQLPDVDPKLTQAVRDALRSTLSSRGIKETLDSADLIVNFRVEVTAHSKAPSGEFGIGHSSYVTGIVIVDLTNPATDAVIWHAQYIDNEESSAKVEKRLTDDVKKLLLEYPPKRKK